MELLNSATNTADREDLLAISALGDIRQYLKSQSVAIVEILVEELHNHLYLKSPYSGNRWAPYTSGQSDLPIIVSNEEQDKGNTNGTKLMSFGKLQIDSFRARELSSEDQPEFVHDRHPEADSLKYVQMLSRALVVVGKLPYALDIMSQRAPFEIFQIVERTIGELRLRHKNITTHANSPREMLENSDVDDDRVEPLKDLLWTVYSKWDAVLQCHRVLYDHAASVQGHFPKVPKGGRSSGSLYDFSDIWKPLEAEMRSLLVSYLVLSNANKDDAGLSSAAAADVFADQPARRTVRGVFSIANAIRSEDTAQKLEEQELRDMLQGSVPGLLSERIDQSFTLSHDLKDNPTTGHLSVSPATPFNIGFVLHATLSFLRRAKRSIPSLPNITPDTISHFLDDFLDTVFDTQLSEAIVAAYRDSVGTILEASVRSDLVPGAPQISRNEIRVWKVVRQIYTLLCSIPYKRESYANMLLSVVQQYYQKYQSWLGNLVSNANVNEHLGSLLLGAAWARRRQVEDIWVRFNSQSDTSFTLRDASIAELKLIFDLKKDFLIRSQDLLQDPAKIEQMVVLHHSLNHFATSLAALIFPESSAQQDQKMQMSSAIEKQFKNILESYRELSKSILVLLRMELRAHVLYYLQLVLGQGNYNIEEKANEVDSTIIDLNADLMLLNLPLLSLAPEDHQMVIDGISLLMDTVLIEDSSSISVMTLHGSEKLMLGIAAMQQNLRNIVPNPEDADLSRASSFFGLFSLGPLGLCDRASTTSLFGLTIPQASKLMTLMYSVDLNRQDSRGNRDSISARRRQLNDSLSLLSSGMSSRNASS